MQGRIGIIGGSGLYRIDDLEDLRREKLTTPFGEPSGEYLVGRIGTAELVFLPRHGEDHRIIPSHINYRANIFGMKLLGVSSIISFSAVGSLKEELRPREIVLVDQFVDRTNRGRVMTFFDKGAAAHVAFSEPTCPPLSEMLHDVISGLGIPVHKGGTYVNMEGPAFSTRAESELHRSWGMDLIGMTGMAEARLAREAEICLAAVALVTDYDCWHAETESVTVEQVIANVEANVSNAKNIIARAASRFPIPGECGCANALAGAIMTPLDRIDDETKKRLEPLIGKYL